MPTFMVMSRHSPENCAMYNEKSRKVFLQVMTKLDELMKKHKSRFIGGWSVPEEHLVLWIVESPSFEAYLRLGMEPEIQAVSSFSVNETKLLTPMEESMKQLQKLQ